MHPLLIQVGACMDSDEHSAVLGRLGTLKNKHQAKDEKREADPFKKTFLEVCRQSAAARYNTQAILNARMQWFPGSEWCQNNNYGIDKSRHSRLQSEINEYLNRTLNFDIAAVVEQVEPVAAQVQEKEWKAIQLPACESPEVEELTFFVEENCDNIYNIERALTLYHSTIQSLEQQILEQYYGNFGAVIDSDAPGIREAREVPRLWVEYMKAFNGEVAVPQADESEIDASPLSDAEQELLPVLLADTAALGI